MAVKKPTAAKAAAKPAAKKAAAKKENNSWIGEIEKIKVATEGLMVASQKFAQQLYEQAAADGGYAQTSQASAGQSDDDVVDADFTDVNDKK